MCDELGFNIVAARGIYRFHLPMRPDTARRIFAAISVDTSLPKNKRDDDDAEAVPLGYWKIWQTGKEQD